MIFIVVRVARSLSAMIYLFRGYFRCICGVFSKFIAGKRKFQENSLMAELKWFEEEVAEIKSVTSAASAVLLTATKVDARSREWCGLQEQTKLTLLMSTVGYCVIIIQSDFYPTVSNGYPVYGPIRRLRAEEDEWKLLWTEQNTVFRP